MMHALQAGLPAGRLSPEQLAQFDAYCRLLMEKNQVMNLTAIREPARVETLHFLDSLSLLPLADFSGKTVLDVGCGAGFPGVPLKIADPSIRLTLLDSLNKRILWLRDELLPALHVEARCVSGRAEDYAKDHREEFDIVTSRAVARLSLLSELCLPLVRPGGLFLSMKGQGAAEEAAEAEEALRILGGKLERIAEYPIEDAVHRVVVIRKLRRTPPEFPRSFAKIKQTPL
ncbi:MAG: 16S rRNA (guanine(527)-N(7))-methyltransferase RsmG [Oscillospiraceae bacterium]|nr:16S rRNA (guanine(527)-N(7))-methyltransferase RsmG [Oscillospiraceae bacterium]